MAHFVRAIKALKLKNKLARYQREKEIKLNCDEDETDDINLKDEDSSNLKWKSSDGFLARCYVKIKTPNTIENVFLKSVLGFMSGVLLTYIFFFFFFYLGVSMSLKVITYTCALAGVFLCLGLAFSTKVRCYVLLLLPVFFSKQGRQALLAYALFLAFTGPAKNTMHNMAILSDSMTCGQEMVRGTLQEIFEMIKAPCRFIKETLERLKKALIEVIETVKAFVMKIKKIIVCIIKVIKKATTWLRSIINLCNKKLGTPFQRCMKTFDDAIADCKAKLGVMDFMCHIVHVVKGLCYTVKCLDFICIFTEFVSDKVVGTVKKKLKEFSLHMKSLFCISIEFSHSYEFETKVTNSTKHVSKTILQKISAKMEKVQTIFSFFGFVFTFLFLLVFFRVYYYKYKYLTSDRFDNLYISKYITELDLKRAKVGRETLLPLEPREKKIYATPSSLRLLRDEKVRNTESMFLLSLTSFKIISFLVFDYSLFWILLTIYEAGRDPFAEAERSSVLLHVEGNGVLADFYRKMGKSLKVPPNPNIQLNSLHCLPDPVTPDMGRYIQIGFLLALCWFLTLTEAYGLRLRNIIMSYYYPDRARVRAVWLYNHILRSRGSFLRFARRRLRRKFHDSCSQPVRKVTLKQRFFAFFPILGAAFGTQNEERSCPLCRGAEAKTAPLKRCKTPDCPGKYCNDCYRSLENVCTICQHPIEYGDISDMSEEIDSSDEDYYKPSTRDSLRITCGSEESTSQEKFMTFKELELRDRFKDLESNQRVDYAKVSDLTEEKIHVQKRLKEALKNRISKLKEIKSNSLESRKIKYARLKRNLQEILRKLKRKKMEKSESGNLQQESIVKSATKSSSSSSSSNSSPRSRGSEEKMSSKKSRVSFKLSVETSSSSSTKLTLKYAEIKEELRERITMLKRRRPNSYSGLGRRRRRRRREEVEEREKKEEDGRNENGCSISHRNPLKRSTTFYFVEREREFDSGRSNRPEIEEIFISELTTSLEDIGDSKINILK